MIIIFKNKLFSLCIYAWWHLRFTNNFYFVKNILTMKLFRIFLLVLCTNLSIFAESKKSYAGYSVLRVSPKDLSQLKALKQLIENVVEVDFKKRSISD